MRWFSARLFTATWFVACAAGATTGLADDVTQGNPLGAAVPAEAGPTKAPPELKRLAPGADVWLDTKNKRVVMIGEVCLREGPLEMFACLKGTKEHEAILAVPTKAYIVHAGLLAAGARAGRPVQYAPEYKAAEGTEIDVTLFWTDQAGKRHKARAQDWVRNVKTQKPLDQPWVFGGSGFWTDERTGERHYQAEDGDFICVSNFPSAMLDLPVASPATAADLLFDAFTERIPPMGTKVTIVLTPKPAAKNAAAKTDKAAPKAASDASETPPSEKPKVAPKM